MFEYLDVLSKGLEPDLIEKSYKFVDRSSGRVMILRPDVTPQVARMVALLMGDRVKPIRLCYSANVFRYEEEHAGREREILQIGAELIGPQDEEADAEILAVVVEILQDLGLNHFRITLGNVGFLKALFEEMGLSEEDSFQIQGALEDRNASRLTQLLEGLAKGRQELKRLSGLLELFGQEEVLEKAEQLLRSYSLESGDSRAALDRLRAVYRLAKRYGYSDCLLLDLTETRGAGYYSGIVFEVFVQGVGYGLGGGGRYDHLISRFGQDLPSVGFALHVDRLQQALQQDLFGDAGPEVDVLVIDGQWDSDLGIRLSKDLRKEGLSVIRRVRGQGRANGYFQPSDRERAAFAVILDSSRPGKGLAAAAVHGAGHGEALWVNCRTGAKKKVKTRELVKSLPSLFKKTGSAKSKDRSKNRSKDRR